MTFPLILLSHHGVPGTTSLILLSHHGIVGLRHNIFYLSEYDYNGKIMHTLTPILNPYHKQVNYTSHLYSVSYVDISNLNIHSNHLEQPAIVCPNLQRLNL